MPTPAPRCREYDAALPPSKKYPIRKAHWWVFTNPGQYAGAVLEIREATNAGATFATRRYAVTENPADGRGRRVFDYYKPQSERRPTGADRYSVRFTHANPRACHCSCPAFQARGKCSHLDALLCLIPNRPAGKPAPAPQTHAWEKRGAKSYRCTQCKMWSYDPALTDSHPTARHCPPEPARASEDRRSGVPGEPAARPARNPPGNPPRTRTPAPPPARKKAPGKAERAAGKGKPHTPHRAAGKRR